VGDVDGLSVPDDAVTYSAEEVRRAEAKAYRLGVEAAVGGLAAGVADVDGVGRLMPRGFVSGYATVWAMSVRVLRATVRDENGRVGVRGTPGGLRTSSGRTAVRGGARSGGVRKGAQNEAFGSVRAGVFRDKIDRQLRKLSRDMDAWFLAEGSGKSGGVLPRRCSKCGRYGEDNWSWCPWDGARMETVDSDG
jgi:hypothetical protein